MICLISIDLLAFTLIIIHLFLWLVNIDRPKGGIPYCEASVSVPLALSRVYSSMEFNSKFLMFLKFGSIYSYGLLILKRRNKKGILKRKASRNHCVVKIKQLNVWLPAFTVLYSLIERSILLFLVLANQYRDHTVLYYFWWFSASRFPA